MYTKNSPSYIDWVPCWAPDTVLSTWDVLVSKTDILTQSKLRLLNAQSQQGVGRLLGAELLSLTAQGLIKCKPLGIELDALWWCRRCTGDSMGSQAGVAEDVQEHVFPVLRECQLHTPCWAPPSESLSHRPSVGRSLPF